MKVLLISGFLGAGKTTFIKELIKHTDKQVAILENEVSSLNIDAGNLQNKELNIWELTEGCICCSTGSDFATSVLTIANSVDPEYLIVEPSGVGMLSNIIKNIKQIEYEHINILAPLTILDADNYNYYMSEYPSIALDQVKNAHFVVVSKINSSNSHQLPHIRSFVKSINKDAEINDFDYKNADKAFWYGILNTGYDKRLIESKEEPESFDTLSFTETAIDNAYKLSALLEDIIRGQHGDIVRAKGSIYTDDHRLSFDLVSGRYSILITYKDALDIEALNSDSDRQTKLVFIGTNILKKSLKEALSYRSTYKKIGLKRI